MLSDVEERYFTIYCYTKILSLRCYEF